MRQVSSTAASTPTTIYELVYTAKNPTVAGIGFAATATLRPSCGADIGAAEARWTTRSRAASDNALIFGSSPSALDPAPSSISLQRERKTKDGLRWRHPAQGF